MARRNKTLAEWRELGAAFNLTLVGNQPYYTREVAQWCCNNCGRTHWRSWDNMRRQKFNCPCRYQTLTRDHYVSLASKLGIEWRGQSLPYNIHIPTRWYSPVAEQVFDAAYHQLGYGEIPKRFQEFLR